MRRSSPGVPATTSKEGRSFARPSPNEVGHDLPPKLNARPTVANDSRLSNHQDCVYLEGVMANGRSAAFDEYVSMKIRKAMTIGALALGLSCGSIMTAGADTPFTSLTSLQSALDQGVNLTALPNLVVPLNRLEPFEWPMNRGCMVGGVHMDLTTPFRSWPGEQTCTFGDVTAKPLIVLYGDSHAGMLLDAVSQFGVVHHDRVVLIALAGCVVASIMQWNFATHTNFTGCDSFRKAAIADIASLHPTAVIIADNTGNIFWGASGKVIPSATYAAAEVATLQALAAPGRKVVLMGNTPDPARSLNGGDPTQCLTIHVSNIGACTFSRSSAEAQLFSQASSAAAGAGAEFIAQTNWFCTQTKCPLVVGHTAVYFNGSHVAKHYYALLQPLFDQALVAAGVK